MKYNVKCVWKNRSDQIFSDGKYSRVHRWIFDGGIELTASSSPQVVPLPMSDEHAVDPEEAFIAAVSSCHMLFFLSIAAANHLVVETYEDNAEGILNKNEEGKMAITKIELKPTLKFSGDNVPSAGQIANIHRQAHEKCYIANSVRSMIDIIPS